MKFISVSDFPPSKIYILLDKNYRKFLIEKSMIKLNCKNYFELSLKINEMLKSKFNGGDINYWLQGERLDKRTGKIHPKFMPLTLVLKLIKLNKEKIESLNKNTISYRSGGRGLVVSKLVLPIKVTPELDSIVIHLFGDGSAGEFTPSYTQKNKEGVDNFIKKLENCFGFFEKSVYFTQGKYQVKFPKAITDILSYYYQIKSYKSYESEIPVIILKRKDNLYKIACIAAFLVDEAQVRDVVLFYSANKILIRGIKRLVKDCNYKSSEVKFNKKAREYYFCLSNKNIEKFYKDLKNLSTRFNTCNLSFKDKDVEFIIKRRKIINPKDSKVTNEIITKLLEKEGTLTAQNISKLSNYAHCTVIHHLKDLYDKKTVKREKITNGSYLWSNN